MQENLSSGASEQLKCIPACASAQSNQRLLFTYIDLTDLSFIFKTGYKQNFTILVYLWSWVWPDRKPKR